MKIGTLTLSTLAAALMFAAAPLHAQRETLAYQRPGWVTMLVKGTSLTKVQDDSVEAICKRYWDKEQASRIELMGEDEDVILAANDSLMMHQRQELRALLTANQQKTFDKNAAELDRAMNMKREMRKHPRPLPPLLPGQTRG
jgi:Spy/CpxP family protein refolding chaperone